MGREHAVGGVLIRKPTRGLGSVRNEDARVRRVGKGPPHVPAQYTMGGRIAGKWRARRIAFALSLKRRIVRETVEGWGHLISSAIVRTVDRDEWESRVLID